MPSLSVSTKSILMFSGNRIPGNPIFLALVKNGLKDSIGLSVSTLYPLLNVNLQSIISPDGGLTKRSDAEIVELIKYSPYLNVSELVGRSQKGFALYQDGTGMLILQKACGYFNTTYGTLYQVDIEGNTVFNAPDIGAYEVG